MEQLENKAMEEARLLAIREYQREWRASNKDKVKKYNHDYWIKRALKQQEAAQN